MADQLPNPSQEKPANGMRTPLLISMGFLGAAVVSTLMNRPADGPGQATLGADYPPARRQSLDDIDHSIWDSLLKKHVDDEGLVDYSSWKASAEDRASLTEYLNTLSRGALDGNASREATLAYWINAYNAVTVEGILGVYPTTSIRNHTPKVAGFNIWKDLLLQAGGGTYSLDDIEHTVLRPMDEPRIHFAIVCASIGCPRLLNQAYSADRLDEQLEDNARHFFAQPRHFSFDAEANTVALSSILKWFSEDFGPSQAELLEAIGPYLPSDDARGVALGDAVRVEYLSYDWGLNEQQP